MQISTEDVKQRRENDIYSPSLQSKYKQSSKKKTEVISHRKEYSFTILELELEP